MRPVSPPRHFLVPKLFQDRVVVPFPIPDIPDPHLRHFRKPLNFQPHFLEHSHAPGPILDQRHDRRAPVLELSQHLVHYLFHVVLNPIWDGPF
jgi:hypothetical protein